VIFGSDDNRIAALRRSPLFAILDKRDLETVARVSREIEVGAGEELIHEGEAGKQFFVLIDGRAEVRRDGADLATLGPGDFFGEISLLSDRPTTASVETMGPARLVVIAPDDFRRLLEEMPLLQMKVIQALADRLTDEFYSSG
jgi:CRP-like cAMP-binding protein